MKSVEDTPTSDGFISLYSLNRDTPHQCFFIQPGGSFSGRQGWRINARNIQIVNKPATLSHVARFIGDVKEFRPFKHRREIYIAAMFHARHPTSSYGVVQLFVR